MYMCIRNLLFVSQLTARPPRPLMSNVLGRQVITTLVIIKYAALGGKRTMCVIYIYRQN